MQNRARVKCLTSSPVVLQTLCQDSQHKVNHNSQDGKVARSGSLLVCVGTHGLNTNFYQCRKVQRFLQKKQTFLAENLRIHPQKIQKALSQTLKRFLRDLGKVSCRISNKFISEISKALSLKFLNDHMTRDVFSAWY